MALHKVLKSSIAIGGSLEVLGALLDSLLAVTERDAKVALTLKLVQVLSHEAVLDLESLHAGLEVRLLDHALLGGVGCGGATSRRRGAGRLGGLLALPSSDWPLVVEPVLQRHGGLGGGGLDRVTLVLVVVVAGVGFGALGCFSGWPRVWKCPPCCGSLSGLIFERGRASASRLGP